MQQGGYQQPPPGYYQQAQSMQQPSVSPPNGMYYQNQQQAPQQQQPMYPQTQPNYAVQGQQQPPVMQQQPPPPMMQQPQMQMHAPPPPGLQPSFGMQQNYGYQSQQQPPAQNNQYYQQPMPVQMTMSRGKAPPMAPPPGYQTQNQNYSSSPPGLEFNDYQPGYGYDESRQYNQNAKNNNFDNYGTQMSSYHSSTSGPPAYRDTQQSNPYDEYDRDPYGSYVGPGAGSGRQLEYSRSAEDPHRMALSRQASAGSMTLGMSTSARFREEERNPMSKSKTSASNPKFKKGTKPEKQKAGTSFGLMSTLARSKKSKKSANTRNNNSSSKNVRVQRSPGTMAEMDLDEYDSQSMVARNIGKSLYQNQATASSRNIRQPPQQMQSTYVPAQLANVDKRMQRQRAELMKNVRVQAWSVQWSAEFRKPYYFNRFTGESVWEPPRDIL